MKHHFRTAAAVLVLPPLVAAMAIAAATDEQKCLASRLKTVGKYEACLFKAYSLMVLKGLGAPETAACVGKLDESWAKIDAKYGSACPASATPGEVATAGSDHAADIYELLGGAVCGNGSIQGSEQCDGAALDGQSCTTRGFDGGSLACSSGCTFDESACTDCGDGVREGTEACDGGALGGESCVSRGYDSGTLACSAACEFDESGCTGTPPTCEPASCGASCGPIGDGCGDSLECGSCTPPQRCGWGGQPSMCGGSCSPINCAAYGAQCGVVPDGCGGTTASCATCPGGQVCTGNPPRCVLGTSCTPLSQGAACGSRECGDAVDGCGDVLSCGTCPAGEGCIYSTGTCSASAPCVPRTCDGLAAGNGTTACNAGGGPAPGCFCGAVADGCGGLLECGACTGGESCGLGGPNICD